jgi:folylpolyglutamate synthase/dihydropteroate synthase
MTLVVASMADKDVDGIILALTRSAALGGARIICTSLDLPRALSAPDLAARWSGPDRAVQPEVEPDPIGAIERALAAGDGPIVIAGSLYLVGAARAHLVDDPELRDPEPGDR